MKLITRDVINDFQRLLDEAVDLPRFRISRMYHKLASLTKFHGLTSKNVNGRGRRKAPNFSRWGHTTIRIDLVDVSGYPRDVQEEICSFLDHQCRDIEHNLGAIMFTGMTMHGNGIVTLEHDMRVPQPDSGRHRIITFLSHLVCYLNNLRNVSNINERRRSLFSHSRPNANMENPFFIVGEDQEMGISGILSSAKTPEAAEKELARFRRTPWRYPDVHIETNEIHPKHVESMQGITTLGDLVRAKLQEGAVKELTEFERKAIKDADDALLAAAGIPMHPEVNAIGQTPSDFSRDKATEAGGEAVKAPVSGYKSDTAEPEIHQESDFRAWADEQYEAGKSTDD